MFGSVILMIHVVLFSYARGPMLGIIVAGVVALWLMPKRPVVYLAFALVLAIGLRLSGDGVREEFMTSFAEEGSRDSSAQSRIELWSVAWDMMLKHPILGVGPDHFPLVVERYGFRAGKEGHNLWLQIGAELGFPGFLLLLSFYGLCIARLWALLSDRESVVDPWFRDAARMVIASLVGFGVPAIFISLDGLEVPYYVTFIGAGVLKLSWSERITRREQGDRGGGVPLDVKNSTVAA
jgi:O-antigen ligase